MMVKVVKAVTNIDHGNDNGKFHYEADEKLDLNQFTKEQLRELFAGGAIMMEEVEEPGPDTSGPEEPEPKPEDTQPNE